MNSNLKESVVLIVDDTPDNIKLMSTILRDKYKIKAVNQGSKACRAAQTLPRPDLILLDILMPHVNGYDVCRQLKKSPDTKDIPVIFLTSLTDMEDEKLGLELGAADYITKPVSPPILLERVKNHLKLKEASDFLKDKNLYLESEVKRRTEQMLFTQNASLIALASLAETRDNETGNHLRRTQLYIESLIKELLRAGRYEKELTPQYIDMTIQSAPVHDIGKVGIPDRILLKPGRLDEQEFRIMKTHSLLGYRAIENAEDDVGEMIGYLTVAKEITLGHHEKWDGSGYP
ncbi:MAG: response regulator, partial [Spirochaetales bacterium]|nr:response regulator [Spirochaetales bacterium]